MFEDQFQQLEERLLAIEARNVRVEADKKWETSLFRKMSILVLTYVVMAVFMHVIHMEKPYLNSIIPAIAFVLSTMTLPFLKRLWLSHKK